jgi:signal transduction histidine kinase
MATGLNGVISGPAHGGIEALAAVMRVDFHMGLVTAESGVVYVAASGEVFMYRVSYRLVSAFVISTSISALAGPARASSGYSHDLFVEYVDKNVQNFWVCDCDGDGWDDYISQGSPQEGCTDRVNMSRIVQGRIQSIEQINIREGRIGNVHVADLDHDQRPEVLLGLADGKRVWLEVWQPKPSRLLRKSAPIDTPDRNGSGSWDGSLDVFECADLDLDDVPDVICGINAGMDRDPRGLLVFSGATLEVIGSCATAGPVDRVKVCEPDDASDTAIVFVTGAVQNGRRVNVFSDDKSYLYAVNRKCEFLWADLAASDMRPWAFDCADLDSDHRYEAIFNREFQEGGPATPYELEIKDVVTGAEIRSLPLAVQAVDVKAVHLDTDTDMELLVLRDDNTIQVMNNDLETIGNYPQIGRTSLRLVDDINFDGLPEIIARIGAGSLFVFDRKMQPIAKADLADEVGKVRLAVAGRSSSYVVAKTGNDVTIMSLISGGMETGSPRWILGSAGMGLLLGSALGATLAYKRTRTTVTKDQLRSRQANDDLLVSLSEFGHSGIARSNLSRLAQYCEAVPEPSSPKRAEHEQRLGAIVRTYLDFTRGLLLRITILSSEQPVTKPRAAKLKRCIRDLDALLPARNDKDCPIAPSIENSARISALARTIHGEVVALRSEVTASYRTDVSGAVCGVVASGIERLAEEQAIQLSVSFKGHVHAQVGEECLKSCLEILMNNAAEAVAACEKKEISIDVSETDGAVLIEVADTGCGIEESDWERIFDRDATTKGSGHGFGLYHARQSLARHSGSIRVRASSPSRGTIMAVRLKAADSSQKSPSQSDQGAA